MAERTTKNRTTQNLILALTLFVLLIPPVCEILQTETLMLIPLVWETVLGFTINLLLGIFASKMNKRYLKLESVILCFLGDFNSQIFVIQFICMNYLVTFLFFLQCTWHLLVWI